jgi:cell division protein FtsW (lipid II flippase)
LKQAVSQTVHAFQAPLIEADARLDELRLRQREGVGELRSTADAIAAIEADIQPYAERYALSGADGAGPRPLACAVAWVQAALDAAPDPRGSDTARANAVLLLAAAVDGRAATPAIARQAQLPATAAPHARSCEGDATEALSAAAALMGDARLSLSNARKNEAMRALMRTAGWQWAGAMLIGFVLLVCSRSALPPLVGVALALAAWALAAWLARVPWPLAAQQHAFETARLAPPLWSRPAGFVMVMAMAAALLMVWVMSSRRASRAAASAQAMSSRIGYAGLVLATGLGWLLLLDLSANGHPANRYLALYHQGHLWLAMLVFSVLLFLRRPLSRAFGRTLSVVGEAARAVAQRLGTAGAAAALALGALAAVVGLGLALSNMRQLTSELGRMWLIFGAAWFFFLRAGPLAERLASAGPAGRSFWRYAWPMLFVAGVLVLAMMVTRDMGPLLIAGYGSGAFLAASVALWWYERSGRTGLAFVLAIVLFSVWIGAITAALFQVGPMDSVTATRLESLAAPLASNNDQLALVAWFQHAAPRDGFGLGAVPWCGYSAAGQCSGVPAQVHSDYTFTAIAGVFGLSAAWTASIACALWLHRLIRHHGRVTRGEPRFVSSAGHIANDDQALLSWVAVGWVVLSLCQLAVTVAGNLAVLPLTGVTFPFVSFGMTSLVVNMAFLALCLNVDVPVPATDGLELRAHDD